MCQYLPIHAFMWSWGKTCGSLDAIPSVTMGSFKVKTLMNSNMTLTVLNLHQKTPKGATTKIQVKSRAANEYSSLGVRGDLGLYSSPF